MPKGNIFKAEAWYYNGQPFTSRQDAIDAKLVDFIEQKPPEATGEGYSGPRDVAKYIRENFDALSEIMLEGCEPPPMDSAQKG